mgnify:CR=1 FL=1
MVDYCWIDEDKYSDIMYSLYRLIKRDVKFTIDGGKMRIKTSGNLPCFYSEIVIAEWLSVADKDDKKEFATDEEDGFYVSLYLTPRAVSVILAVIKCLEEDFEKTGITVSVKTVYDILTANKEKKSVTNVKIPVFSETSVAD